MRVALQYIDLSRGQPLDVGALGYELCEPYTMLVAQARDLRSVQSGVELDDPSAWSVGTAYLVVIDASIGRLVERARNGAPRS